VIIQSLAIVVENQNFEVVQLLLDENVAKLDLQLRKLYVGQPKDVMEMFVRYIWDISQLMDRNEPPALRYGLDPVRQSNFRGWSQFLSIPFCTCDQDMVE
jgi:hypothetical protein